MHRTSCRHLLEQSRLHWACPRPKSRGHPRYLLFRHRVIKLVQQLFQKKTKNTWEKKFVGAAAPAPSPENCNTKTQVFFPRWILIQKKFNARMTFFGEKNKSITKIATKSIKIFHKILVKPTIVLVRSYVLYKKANGTKLTTVFLTKIHFLMPLKKHLSRLWDSRVFLCKYLFYFFKNTQTRHLPWMAVGRKPRKSPILIFPSFWTQFRLMQNHGLFAFFFLGKIGFRKKIKCQPWNNISGQNSPTKELGERSKKLWHYSHPWKYFISTYPTSALATTTSLMFAKESGVRVLCSNNIPDIFPPNSVPNLVPNIQAWP